MARTDLPVVYIVSQALSRLFQSQVTIQHLNRVSLALIANQAQTRHMALGWSLWVDTHQPQRIQELFVLLDFFVVPIQERLNRSHALRELLTVYQDREIVL
jgi:hypothetical protein